MKFLQRVWRMMDGFEQAACVVALVFVWLVAIVAIVAICVAIYPVL